MDWIPVIFALGILGVLGLVFGVVLTLADKKLSVEADPRVGAIGKLMGGANCGVCGFTSCEALAEAIVAGKALPTLCPTAKVERIGQILGVDIEQAEKRVARVICQGHYGVAKGRYSYDGYRSCLAASAIAGGPKLCHVACLGMGDCEKACVYGAISMDNGIAHIDEKRCTACGKCVDSCPRNAIRLVPAADRVLVLCRNEDVGRAVRGICMRACIACGQCEKACKYDAIAIVNGHATIDFVKCTRCGACAKVCPCGCIEDYSN